MNDLDIRKRIAEIEGVGLFETYSQIFDKKKLVSIYMDTGVKWQRPAENEECFFTKVYSAPSQYTKATYNPLTDDALCFQLMVKYKIDFFHVNGIYCASDNKLVTAQCDTPNKAICLAIIEAHKEQ